MQKNMVLNFMDIDTNRGEMKISGSFDSWESYVRTAVYFRNDPKFKLVEQGSPTWKDNSVKFTWTFEIK